MRTCRLKDVISVIKFMYYEPFQK